MALNTNKYNFATSTSLFYGDSAYDATTSPSNEQKILSLYDSTGGDDYFGNCLAIGDGILAIAGGGSTVEGRVEVYKLADSAGASTTPYMTLRAPDAAPASSSSIRKFGGISRNTTTRQIANPRDFEYISTNIAIGGGRIAVTAADYEDVGSGFAQFAGALYVYDYDGNLINTQYGITGSSDDYPTLDESMGTSIAIGCGRIVLGSSEGYGDTGPANSLDHGGNIYIFDMDGNRIGRKTIGHLMLQQGQFWTDRNVQSGDGSFGKSVAVGNGKIVVGFPGGNPQQLSSGDDWGLVYVLDLNGNYEYSLKPPDGFFTSPSFFSDKGNYHPMFGHDVAIGHGLIAVGTPDDNSSPQTGSSDGYVFVYDLKGKYLFSLEPDDDNTGYIEQFGYNVRIADGRIYVSTSEDRTNQYVYVFDLSGNRIAKVIPSDHTGGDGGHYLAAGDGYLAIAAPGDNNANGVNGGAVYLYETPKQNTVLDILDKITV